MLASRDKLAGSNVELKEIGLQRPSHDVQLVHLGLELVKLRVMDLYFSDDALPIAALQQRE